MCIYLLCVLVIVNNCLDAHTYNTARIYNKIEASNEDECKHSVVLSSLRPVT